MMASSNLTFLILIVGGSSIMHWKKWQYSNFRSLDCHINESILLHSRVLQFSHWHITQITFFKTAGWPVFSLTLASDLSIISYLYLHFNFSQCLDDDNNSCHSHCCAYTTVLKVRGGLGHNDGDTGLDTPSRHSAPMGVCWLRLRLFCSVFTHLGWPLIEVGLLSESSAGWWIPDHNL